MNTLTSHVWARSASPWIGVLWACALKIGEMLGRLSRFLDQPPSQGEGSRKTLRSSEPGGPISVLVIDASPSMDCDDWSPSRLQAAKDAAKAYIVRLKLGAPDARVAVVAYHMHAKTVCKLRSVGEIDQIVRGIDRISTDSATNITAGLEKAHSILRKTGGRGQVVLLTDGEHNSGPEPRGIATKLRKIAVVETIGIGGTPADVDETLLKSIASENADGGKRYRWIGDKEELVGHFEALAGRLARS